ncbi:hypothetical protein BKA70DRAFT_1236765 [Coprinopsis sp. MPI-PUGE-AT-0042]|nr:hypothetical protein BKA70DRAFT_1236765 [Coprinopsis sp. MPI-PUGE-AT-0042]
MWLLSKSGEDRKAAQDVLEQSKGLELADGCTEDDKDKDKVSSTKKSSGMSELERRRTRICLSDIGIAQAVDGLTWVEGRLTQKVDQWQEEGRVRELRDEKSRTG